MENFSLSSVTIDFQHDRKSCSVRHHNMQTCVRAFCGSRLFQWDSTTTSFCLCFILFRFLFGWSTITDLWLSFLPGTFVQEGVGNTHYLCFNGWYQNRIEIRKKDDPFYVSLRVSILTRFGLVSWWKNLRAVLMDYLRVRILFKRSIILLE